jgi:sugar transferase (PEP-CTERM/EpsH1 system associated)
MVETATPHMIKPESTGEPAPVRPLHIVHVVRRGRAEGGMENGVVNVTNRLPADRYRVSICALDSEETFSSRIQRPGTEYFLLPKTGGGIDWGLVLRLAKLLRRCRADLVHSHNWGTFIYSVLAAKLAGVPIVHGEHGKNIGEIDGDGAAKRMVKRTLGRGVERIVTVCQSLADEWVGYGIPKEKVQCILNGVDASRFHPCESARESRKQFELPESAFMVGSIGRLDELKNYEVLIAALGQLKDSLPEVHLAVLGDGPRKERLSALAEELGIAKRVHLLGFRNRPESFLAALDIFALPSKYEGMSNVVLEAMSSGLPIVCADLPSHREVFSPGVEGEMVNPSTAELWAERLAELYQNAQRRRAMGLAAHTKVVEKFSLEKMVCDYDRLYAAHTTGRSNQR